MPFPRTRRQSGTAAGLGWDHQQVRRRLLPLAYGTPCPYCGGVMAEGQQLDLDHAVPRALGGTLASARIAHRTCNRKAGARLGGKLSHARGKAARRAVAAQPRAAQARQSRAW